MAKIYTITPAMLAKAGLSLNSALAAFTLRGNPDPADRGKTFADLLDTLQPDPADKGEAFADAVQPRPRAASATDEPRRRWALDGAIHIKGAEKR